jgi:hypothetical protein
MLFQMAFTEDIIQKVWEKGEEVPGYDSKVFRKDQCDAWIIREMYGFRNTLYGWEIDHINPVTKGGSGDLDNLRPLQWENKSNRQDEQLVCVIISNGEVNIKK